AVKTQIWIAVSGLRAGGDRAQTAGTGGQPVPDSADSQPHAFRENTYFMRSSGHRPGRKFRRKRQPADSLRLLTGQQWEKYGKVKKAKGTNSIPSTPEGTDVVVGVLRHVPAT